MHELTDILKNVINDAMRIGFPVSDALERKIYIDKATYDRVGACYRYPFPERYEIHLSEDTQKAHINIIRDIIAHEVLHTSFITMDHNCFWMMYQEKMNSNLGYNIQIKYSWNEILK